MILYAPCRCLQVEDLDPDVLKSRQLASKTKVCLNRKHVYIVYKLSTASTSFTCVVHFSGQGNVMASSGHYQTAIELFTEACKFDPSDFRLV